MTPRYSSMGTPMSWSFICLMALALLVITLGPMVASAQTTVDDFSITQGFQLVACPGACPPGCPVPAVNYATNAAILGGERDIELTMVACVFGGTTTSSLVSGGTYVGNNATGVESVAVIQWDGVDGSPVLNPTGISPTVDLTATGQNTFRLRVAADDLPNPVKIDVYSDAANASTFTVTLPGGIVAITDFGFDFASFSTLLGAGVNWTSVSAVQMVAGAAGFAAVDLTLDFLRTDVGPVPVNLVGFAGR